MSNQLAIRTSGLSKTFRQRRRAVQAVTNLNLEVAAGQVYGFLGPNGAGKTTTIRMLVQLIFPTSGEVHLFGGDPTQEPLLLRRLGAQVESAAFYGFLSGRRNLEVLGRTAGAHRPERAGALLEQIGLGESADRIVKGYSTGMKQRLGIAAALLHDPDLLILDEPTNGLDPAGIQEMRGFIRGLVVEHGKTVFLSSHLLSEVEQVCDRVAIIRNGEMVHEGAVDALLSSGASLYVQAAPLERALAALAERWKVAPERETDGEARHWLVVEAAASDAPAVVERLVERGVAVSQVVIRKQSLEQFFLSVTSEEDTND